MLIIIALSFNVKLDIGFLSSPLQWVRYSQFDTGLHIILAILVLLGVEGNFSKKLWNCVDMWITSQKNENTSDGDDLNGPVEVS